jgi:dTDP-4-amino-4,6-dideoxygalactose transaminase
MNKLQSAVGLTQLAKVDEVNRKRHENARLLSRLLADVPEIIAPFDDETHFCPYHLYMLRFDDEAAGASRDAFLKLPREKYKVAVMIHYPPLWNFSFYRDQGYGTEGLPVASRVLRQLFNVPVH